MSQGTENLRASQIYSGNLNFGKHVVNSGHSFGKMERHHVSSFYNKEGETLEHNQKTPQLQINQNGYTTKSQTHRLLNPLFSAIFNPVFPMLLNGALGFHYKVSTFSLLAFTNTVVS